MISSRRATMPRDAGNASADAAVIDSRIHRLCRQDVMVSVHRLSAAAGGIALGRLGDIPRAGVAARPSIAWVCVVTTTPSPRRDPLNITIDTSIEFAVLTADCW